MKSLIFKVVSYILFSYVIYLGIVYANKDAKFIKLSDLQNDKDWFYFALLFFLPVFIDILIIGLPMSYGLDKITKSAGRYIFYLLFIALFVLEFIVGNWIYGTQASILKIGISLILFLILGLGAFKIILI